MEQTKIVVLTISDSCANKINEDKSGPLLVSLIEQCDNLKNVKIENHILPDEEALIIHSLIQHCDIEKADIIFTVGGTGFSQRDVTPEATRKVIDKLANGISTAICISSLQKTPMAMTSRAISGIRKNTLIINFPGSTKAVQECFQVVKCILPHSVELLKDNIAEVKETHKQFGCGCSNKPKSDNNVRDRISPYPMIEFDTATSLIKETLKQKFIKRTHIVDSPLSLGYVTAEDIFALEPFPPFDASIKDGYACMYEDQCDERKVCYNISAGDNPTKSLSPGECAIINTGAPIPPGANCVVQIEDTLLIRAVEDKEVLIKVNVAPQKNQDIRKIGSDIKQNEKVIPVGKLIQPADVGLLATIGKMNVSVFHKPTIGLLSTGNELCQPNKKNIKLGQIRDTNKVMLTSLFSKYGFTVGDQGIVKDDPYIIKNILKRIFLNIDVLITTGSVSMGDKDFLKSVLIEEFNANIVFGRVNMKPGKPMTFATCIYNGVQKFIFALPGNPVSALVTSQLLVIPALMYMIGIDNYTLPQLNVILDEDVELDQRPHFARAVMQYNPNGYPRAVITGNQISSRLISSSNAELLLRLPGSEDTRKRLSKDAIVPAFIIN